MNSVTGQRQQKSISGARLELVRSRGNTRANLSKGNGSTNNKCNGFVRLTKSMNQATFPVLCDLRPSLTTLVYHFIIYIYMVICLTTMFKRIFHSPKNIIRVKLENLKLDIIFTRVAATGELNFIEGKMNRFIVPLINHSYFIIGKRINWVYRNRWNLMRINRI